MTLDRHALAERLRPHLSPTEPRLASELLVLAGVQTGSRVGGTVAAALQELRAAGHARPAGGTRQALRWLASAPGDLGSETLPLARLDATLTLTTTARTTAGGTRRTELAATVTLGPSWPTTTPTPPRWSTALNDAQVAGGALAGARTNAITRAEAQLRALRTSKTTLPLLPTEDRMTRPNPLLLPSKDREDFLAYLASVARGARQDSACAWLAKRNIAETTDEALAWLDELVVKGLITERIGAASDGSRVVRYSPADPSVKPAPLPKSSAPAEEPPPAPKAPSKPAAAPVIEEDPGDPADDTDAEDDPRALEEEDPPEEGEIEKVRCGEWVKVDDLRLRFCSSLGLSAQVEWPAILDRVRDVKRERDVIADRVSTLTTERDDLALSRDHREDARCAMAQSLGLSGGASWQRVTNEVRSLAGALDELKTERDRLRAQLEEAASDALRARAVYQPDPAEQFATSIAGWLVGLSDDTWLEVTRARHQLAESRRLREQSHSLELHALDALDRAVGARPAAQASAPVAELVPDPIPLGPPIPAAPEPPASAEQANDGEGATKIDRALAYFRAHPDEEVRAGGLAYVLGGERHEWTVPLSSLANQGLVERTARGIYRLARKSRRAA